MARLNLFAEVLELPKRLFNVVVPGGTQDPLLLTGVAMAGLPREVVVAVVRVQARADPLKILLCLVVPLAVVLGELSKSSSSGGSKRNLST